MCLTGQQCQVDDIKPWVGRCLRHHHIGLCGRGHYLIRRRRDHVDSQCGKVFRGIAPCLVVAVLRYQQGLPGTDQRAQGRGDRAHPRTEHQCRIGLLQRRQPRFPLPPTGIGGTPVGIQGVILGHRQVVGGGKHRPREKGLSGNGFGGGGHYGPGRYPWLWHVLTPVWYCAPTAGRRHR
ncbi:Uncharacterised protein [Mycobacteroides abscessus subsp. massiliense]|nr:Uncharacterised protein [Mycobacteroides abscessus subsp. massiliense]